MAIFNMLRVTEKHDDNEKRNGGHENQIEVLKMKKKV